MSPSGPTGPRIGPGLLVTAAFLGPGTITTATLAGAETGYALLWVLPVAVAIAFVLQELTARASLTAEAPPALLIAELGPGPGAARRWAAWLAVGGVVLGATAFQAGNLTGAALGLEAIAGGPRWAWVLLGTDIAGLLLWFGGYRLVERALGGLVAVMGVAFVATVAMAGVDLVEAIAGLVPDPSITGRDLGLVLALVGTTVVPYNLFLHSSALRAGGQRGSAAIAGMRWDLGVSIVLGGLVSGAVVLTAAATLQGVNVEDAAAMAVSLEPLVGQAARWSFGVGLAAAGLTSAITAPLAASLATAQLTGQDEARPPAWVWGGVLAVGTAVALLPFEPIGLIVAAQGVNALLLPGLALVFLVVANRDRLGPWANGPVANAAGLLVLLATAILGLALLL